MDKRKWGSILAATSYVLMLVGMFVGHITAEFHNEPIHETSQYLASWPMHLLLSLVIVEVYLCWVPLRKGEGSAFWLALIPLVILGFTRLAHDPRCLGSLHEHGCHTFLLALLLGFVGLAMVKLAPA